MSPFALPFFSILPWIIYLYTGLAAEAATVVIITVFVLDQKKRKQHGHITP